MERCSILGAIPPVLRSIFGRKLNTEEYFTRILQYSMALSLTGGHRAFSEIAIAVLRMEADARKINLTETDAKRLAAALRKLSQFPNVEGSLRKLQKANFRMAVLTNSASEAARGQLAPTKLS